MFHIELNTQNPNQIFKITFSFTKAPTMPNNFRFVQNIFFVKKERAFSNLYFVLCINCIIHILYFLGIVVILGFGDFYINLLMLMEQKINGHMLPW